MDAIGWAALCARSESNQSHEWPAILTVIRNRVEDKGYPEIVEDVVRQPFQFSYFNPWARKDLESQDVFEEARKGYPGRDYETVRAAAQHVFDSPRWALPFGRKVLNFWSPVSMDPAYSLPDWNWDILRCFEVSGIDPTRFVFAETVDHDSPMVGAPIWLAEGEGHEAE